MLKRFELGFFVLAVGMLNPGAARRSTVRTRQGVWDDQV